jgi:N-glycosylase/DNA lyase
MAESLEAPDFDLRHTIECGQFFRWTLDAGRYRVQTGPRCFLVWQEGDRLFVEGEDPVFIAHFFSLDHDLAEIREAVARDLVMRGAFQRYWGLRLIRQDPWECLASFITSIASNIPRITRNVEDMAKRSGDAFRRFGGRHFVFPRPAAMPSEKVLRRIGLGFRASYLEKAARLAATGMLEELLRAGNAELRDSLMCIPGVAEKVADCVMLYAYGRLDAFPVDTWIRKAMRRFYFKGRNVNDAAIRATAAERFGAYAGYAQQYLFIHARENWKTLQSAPYENRDQRRLRADGAGRGAPRPGGEGSVARRRDRVPVVEADRR